MVFDLYRGSVPHFQFQLPVNNFELSNLGLLRRRGLLEKSISPAIKHAEKNPDVKKEKAVADFPQGHIQEHDNGSKKKEGGYSCGESIQKR